MVAISSAPTARTLLERSWSGEKKSSPLVTVQQTLATVKETPYTFGHRSESFELHKLLRAVRKRLFSAPAKFTIGLTVPSQSLAQLDASSWTLGSVRPTHRYFASFAQAVI